MAAGGLDAFRRTSLAVLSAACLTGCVSNAAPGSTESYANSMQATMLATGIASSVDPTGISSVAGGMAYRIQQQARMAQTIGSVPMSTDPGAELARARAYGRAMQEERTDPDASPSE